MPPATIDTDMPPAVEGAQERRLGSLEQHVEVLQAQVDALQSQLQKEASRSVALGKALHQSHAELRAAQLTAAEAVQAIFELVGSPARPDLDSRTSTTIFSDGGADCAAAALEKLRARLAAVPGDLASELGSTASVGGSPRSVQTIAQPPKLPPRGPPVGTRRSSDVPGASPTLLGRTTSIDAPSTESAAKALAMALARERELAGSYGGDTVGSSVSPSQRRRPMVEGTNSLGSSASMGFFGGSGGNRSPVQRMRSTGSVDNLNSSFRQRSSAGAAEHLLSEINELRQLNSALREENVEIRDKILRKGGDSQDDLHAAQRASHARLPSPAPAPLPPQTTVGNASIVMPVPSGSVPIQRMSSLGTLPTSCTQTPPVPAHRIIAAASPVIGSRTVYQPVLHNRVVLHR